VDDLHELVHDDEGHRQEEAEKAENLVDLRVDRFVEWYRARAAVPTVRDLRRWAETIRTSELEELSHKVDPQTYEALDRLSGRLMNKFLHVPTVGIRESAVHDGGSDLLTHVRRLFRLDDYDCR
jgi:glutamyl-tRNA reductase